MNFSIQQGIMKRGILLFILISLIFLLSEISQAQVINIEKIRKYDEEGLAGTIGLGFFYNDNGKKIATFKNNIQIQYDHGPNTFIFLNDLNLMRVDKDNLVNAGFQHVRYNYTIKDSSFFTVEAFFQHQYNTIKLLKKRFLVGFGPRFRLLGTEKSRLYIGTLGMYEYEVLSDSLETSRKIARLGSYISFSWNILKNLSFSSITYYQPAFVDFQNFRLSSESSFQLKITDSFSFRVGIQANYDSKPPDNIQKLFYNWENELTFNF
jgi:putative salt-induced outer membrane protein YdiY